MSPIYESHYGCPENFRESLSPRLISLKFLMGFCSSRCRSYECAHNIWTSIITFHVSYAFRRYCRFYAPAGPCYYADGFWVTKSEGVGLIVRAISLQDFQPMWSWSTNVTDGQTHEWHAIAILRFVLYYRPEMLQVPKPQLQVQVQVLKSNYQVQPKYRYRYVINTRQHSYRTVDRAMRPIYGCPEKFSESSLRSRLFFQKFVMDFCSDRC